MNFKTGDVVCVGAGGESEQTISLFAAKAAAVVNDVKNVAFPAVLMVCLILPARVRWPPA